MIGLSPDILHLRAMPTCCIDGLFLVLPWSPFSVGRSKGLSQRREERKL
jgi:hypothetical protein